MRCPVCYEYGFYEPLILVPEYIPIQGIDPCLKLYDCKRGHEVYILKKPKEPTGEQAFLSKTMPDEAARA